MSPRTGDAGSVPDRRPQGFLLSPHCSRAVFANNAGWCCRHSLGRLPAMRPRRRRLPWREDSRGGHPLARTPELDADSFDLIERDGSPAVIIQCVGAGRNGVMRDE